MSCTTCTAGAAGTMNAAAAEPTQGQQGYAHPLALIGSGPGDPELITCKGRRLLSEADIIIYDYLANPKFLALAKPDARLISVGKKGFTKHITQDEINAILIEQAQAYPKARIVRLKGGDPFLFGRGGEEAQALAAVGIPFEIVPGITAGIAAPAFAGIPVTQRHVASSVAFITGHETPEKTESSIDWKHLALGCDTLCFYMGVKNLPMISRRLIEAGRSPKTPVALVRWGSLPEQESLVSTLDCVADDAQKRNFQAPAIIVVGEVVQLREQLSWFERRPLFGKTVVVTRARTQASGLTKRLEHLGARVLEVPAIRIEALPDTDCLQAAIASLGAYAWTIFTSVNGADLFFAALRRAGLDARAFAGCKVAAIGEATAEACIRWGIYPDLVPERYVAESMAEALLDAGAAGKRILIPRAQEARETLPELLGEAGCEVNVLPLYQTLPEYGSSSLKQAIELMGEGGVDAVTFTSSSTVKNFWALMEEECGADCTRQLLEKTGLFSIGPVTSKTLHEFGLEPTAEATIYTIEGLIACLEAVLA